MPNVRITDLPAAQTLDGTELVPVVQQGVTVRTTTDAIASVSNNTETFITVNNEPTLENSRSLAVQSGLQLVDGGAQSTITIARNSYYGSFYDTTSQSIASTTTAYAVGINTTAESNGVSIVSGSRITFAHAGVYNVQFSVQLVSSNVSIHDVTIWLRLNGSDVPYSAGMISVPNKHGGINGAIIATWNYVLTLSANDYLQLYWAAESVDISIDTLPAGTTPTTPVSPSVILTAVLI
jgi:hypothetical protein